MTDPTIGPLVPLDETFDHQVVDTFATVGTTDRSWTEKVAAQAAATDGSLQVAFGIGKYTNRGVVDAYAGVSRGVEQWTVRASRELASDPTGTAVGPLRYEVDEPFRRVRFVLEPNDVQPVAFDWTFVAAVPARLEEREQRRSRDRSRREEDLVRYHQVGRAEGWVELDGTRHDLTTAGWFASRDHSWGVRQQVGAPPPDVAPRPEPAGLSVLVSWAPMLLERPDGSVYGLHHYAQHLALGDWRSVRFQGAVEHPDGSLDVLTGVDPALRFDPHNRRLRGGTYTFRTATGAPRPVHVQALGETGFHLGAGLYFGFDGHWHGEWRGPLHVDGEHVPDCTTPAAARRLHQLRDCVVAVEDPVGGGRGWGDVQTIVTGAHPDLGLDAERSFT